MRLLRRKWWVGLIVLAFVMVAPFTAAAATNAEIIDIMVGVIDGIITAGKDAYCAADIVAFCP